MRRIESVRASRAAIVDIVAMPNGEGLLVSSGDGTLAVHALDGKRIRTLRKGDDDELVPSRVVACTDDTVVLCGWEHVEALRLRDGERAWSCDELEGSHELDCDDGGFCTIDGVAFLPGGSLLDVRTGRVVGDAAEAFDGVGVWCAVATRDGFVVSFDDGHVARVRPGASPEILASFGDEECATQLACDGGPLFALLSSRTVTIPPTFDVPHPDPETEPISIEAFERCLVRWTQLEGEDDEDIELSVFRDGHRIFERRCVSGTRLASSRGPRDLLIALADALVLVGAEVSATSVPRMKTTAALRTDRGAIVGTDDGRLVFFEP